VSTVAVGSHREGGSGIRKDHKRPAVNRGWHGAPDGGVSCNNSCMNRGASSAAAGGASHLYILSP